MHNFDIFIKKKKKMKESNIERKEIVKIKSIKKTWRQDISSLL